MAFIGDRLKKTEENAATLQLGPDFEHAKPVMNAEVAILLAQHLATQSDAGDIEDHERENTALEYARRFGNFTQKETVAEVRALLEARHLHDYEVAALANLCLATVEEARTIIPSLTAEKISDQDLSMLLEELGHFRGEPVV